MRSMRMALAALLLAATGAQAEEFGQCMAHLRGEAQARGIRHAVFDGATEGLEPDRAILEAMDAQPEFVRPIWDYLAALVDERRIADGRRKLTRWSELLERIERQFGVDRHVVVAIWGVESNFGERLGRRPLVQSLATVSCFGRRQRFFREELFATLRIVQAGDIASDNLRGSWAGAFGHTQFMPTTYQRLAVDFDGDGRRDLVASIPDALASTANYLRESGWKQGETWGYEVRLPRGYAGPVGRKARRPMQAWRDLGVKRIDGRDLPGDAAGALLLPAGLRGPAFVVLGNFNAIYSYNPAESYALAIAHLADRLSGGGAIRGSWPVDDPPLSRDERMEVQSGLRAHGFDVGDVDGIIGPRTVQAIKEFQEAAGLPVDGYAGMRLLRTLNATALPPS